jgi:demethylmenaquinone methyltransferase/2-methoxy-6-polyprenyl-1,4-benzoquinol methylase
MSTHFGFQTVDESEKAAKVARVFDSVAGRYDVMNDVMSAGLHRLWKRFAIKVASPQTHEQILDIASGTGDIARLIAKTLMARGGTPKNITMTDINASMLNIGQARLLDEGLLVRAQLADCEQLAFPNAHFHLATLAFGLRNMTDKARALAEIHRVLKPGGRVVILEFSTIAKPFQKAYDAYSFGLIPQLGGLITGDRDSYQYLVESIRRHPDQETLKTLMEAAGFEQVEYWNLSAGAVAVHRGYKY